MAQKGQKGQNFQLCSWLIKTNGTVWNELATSQGTLFISTVLVRNIAKGTTDPGVDCFDQ